MDTITFTIKKRLACYVASITNDISVLSAIAKATIGITDMEADVTVTIYENEVISIFRLLTVVSEGIGAVPNDELFDVLLPLLPDHPNLGLQISYIVAENTSQRNSYIIQGSDKLTQIQTALNNN